MRDAFITFRTKLRTLDDGRRFFMPKVRVSRTDCNLRPHENDYYNSDLFEPMLNRAYKEAFGGLSWVSLDSLPEGVTVDSSGFLAMVKVELKGLRR